MVRPHFENSPLGSATGFLVTFVNTVYLVTNWHVVTGRRADDGTVIQHATGAIPDRLEVALLTSTEPPEWQSIVEPLYDDEGAPRWLSRPPVEGRTVDVAALPLSYSGGFVALGHDPFAAPQLNVAISDQVSIVGFPHGETGGGGHLAVWMQGTVASEPEVDHRNLPVFLVDSRTRPGMSGSPVIAYTHGGVRRNSDGSATLGGPPVEMLLGIYSGRIHPDSDLGTVWRARVIREIISGKLEDSTDLEGAG